MPLPLMMPLVPIAMARACPHLPHGLLALARCDHLIIITIGFFGSLAGFRVCRGGGAVRHALEVLGARVVLVLFAGLV